MKEKALKSSKLSGNRLMLMVFGGMIFLIIYFIASFYYSQINNSKKEVLEKLEVMANSSSILINGDIFEKLIKNQSGSSVDLKVDTAYLTIQQQILALANSNTIAPSIQTLYYDSASLNFKTIISSTNEPHNPDNQLHNVLKDKYLLGSFDNINGYFDKNNLSAFSPIYNLKGNVVGVVQVTQDFESYFSVARNNMFKNLSISVLIFSVVSFMLFGFMKSFLKKEDSFKIMILEQNNEIINKNVEIETQNQLIQDSNNKLEDARRTIEGQNKDLKVMNQVLDMKVKQRTTELEQVNQDLSAFLYRSSHDIMGPIATLQGLLNIAGMEVKDPIAQDFITKFEVPIKKLNRIIKSVNSIFNIKTKELEYLNINLKEFFNNIIDHKLIKQNKEGFQFIFDFDDDLEINSDPVILESVFFELFKNAILYKNKKESNPYLRISCQKTTRRLTITLKDNGAGLEPELKEKIKGILNNPYILSEAPGMGLYIVKSALNKLKSDIKILDQPDNKVVYEIIIRLKHDFGPLPSST
jgi:signal transduction histidine kinase